MHCSPFIALCRLAPGCPFSPFLSFSTILSPVVFFQSSLKSLLFLISPLSSPILSPLYPLFSFLLHFSLMASFLYFFFLLLPSLLLAGAQL